MTDDNWMIEMLGWLRVSRGSFVHRSLSQKSATLLAYLALHSQTAHSREALAGLLWPDAPRAASRHSLRTSLYELRRLLESRGSPPGAVLATDRESARLVAGAFTTDVAEFVRASAEAAVAEGVERADAIRRALEWYRGDFLAGYFDSWIFPERRRLAALYADGLAQLLETLRESGHTSEAIDVAHRLIAINPLDEDIHVRLMRLYAAAGRVGAALDQYRALVGVLQDELGIEPSAAARSVALELRQHATPGAAGATRESAIQARVAKPSAPTPSRVPTHLTRFVGRDEELERLRALLVEGETRLVTIVGAGGIGKTRLAAELGRRIERDAGATVFFVELADVADEASVADSVASVVGLRAFPGGDLLDAVAGMLADATRPLLVLDNAEQLASAVAHAVRHLLGRLPALRVLVTSRRALEVSGENELRLSPLPTPMQWELPEDLGRNPSVALYVDRVRTKRANFELTEANAAAVARLCTKLEGIPLALELAAGRERVLPAAQMIARLEKRFEVLVNAQRDVPERHRTLSAAIDWSFRALDHEARRMLARLSVFRGGWSLEEGEAICATPDAVEALERMCDVSLVEVLDRSETRRFRMLETIREFASEHVPPEERDKLRRLHAHLFLALAERAHVNLRGAEQAAWFERIDAEFENIRSGLDWSLRSGDVVTVVRMFVALSRYWPARSRRREARRWFRDAVDRGRGRLPRRLLGRGLRHAADLAFAEGDLAEAKRDLEEALPLFDEDDDPTMVAYLLSGLGHVAARYDEFDAARDLLLRSRQIATSRADAELRAMLANDLGILEARTGHHERALELFLESLSLYREIGDDTSVVVLLFNLGYLATIVGRFDDAEGFLEESLSTSRRLGHDVGLASASTFLGLLELRRGHATEAIERCRSAADLCLEVGERYRLVLAVEGLGVALAGARRDRVALLALGHAAALRDETETEALLEDPELRRQCVETLTARVGAAEADRLLAAGRDASTEQILAAVAGDAADPDRTTRAP